MTRSSLIQRGLAVLLVCTLVASVRAQPQRETFTNLKVLPKDVSPGELRAVMGGFTRALGVRCGYCHVGEEGKPIRHEDFALDDKPAKRTARAMMRMVQELNDAYLAKLETRADPPVRVECATCHRGAPQPRMLQDVLKQAYDHGGLDSTIARYQGLRDRYYGRAVYDFGEASLAILAGQIGEAGHPADAVRLQAFNVEQNPKSVFAKRQHATAAISLAFAQGGSDSGAAAYHALQGQYGPQVVSDALLGDVGHELLREHQMEPALAALKLNVADHPASARAHEGLGEAYEQHGDLELAAQSYQRALEIEPGNDDARHRLDALKARAGGKGN
ncbi:MAG TPA: c-type cytochrome [Candidatus Saccharimonadales bacterium]|nr:c-type cytochrome [Candidatus Saccharimonadales bacterium]